MDNDLILHQHHDEHGFVLNQRILLFRCCEQLLLALSLLPLHIPYLYQRMGLQELIKEWPDVACWLPLMHGWHHRALRTGYMLWQQIQSVLVIRPRSQHVQQERLSFHHDDEQLLFQVSNHLHLNLIQLVLLHNDLLRQQLNNGFPQLLAFLFLQLLHQ